MSITFSNNRKVHEIEILKATVCDGQVVKRGDIVKTESLFLVHAKKARMAEPKPKKPARETKIATTEGEKS